MRSFRSEAHERNGTETKMTTCVERKRRIAVIGAGASGLAAIYCCCEENLDVVCFEKSDNLGGLWKYREEVIEGQACVMKSTLMNSSKEMSAFSTFPPPKEFPNYMHHSVVLRYFEMYAEKFGLKKYIRFKHEVIKADRSKDFDETGRWVLKVRNNEKQELYEDVFDGVMVCTGHHVAPIMPQYPGMEEFKGQILHSRSYRTPKGFENKKIVVVGNGNSGCDIATELGGLSEKVYLSTRRGFWVFPRLSPGGIPFDTTFITRFSGVFLSLLPFNTICWYLEKQANKVMDYELYGIKPSHRILSENPTFNDLIPNRIIGGLVTIKGNIKRFFQNGVVFEGDEDVCEADVVIMATGYEIRFPFLDEDVYQMNSEKSSGLYKLVFSPDLSKPTLGFIGLIDPFGPIFSASEMQSRWFCAVMNNKVLLPDREKMLKDIEEKRKRREQIYVKSKRHVVSAYWLPYMDEIASEIEVKPNLLRLAVTDPVLWHALVFGPSVSYQYRLTGRHSWPGARKAILALSERFQHPFKTRQVPGASNSEKQGSQIIIYVLGIFLSFIIPFLIYFILN